jgi:nucleoside-diphosphate-sugar epimerase
MRGTVLITGGTGFIGSALARRLIANADTTVRLLGRDFSSAADLLSRGAACVRADLRDADAVAEACKGCRDGFPYRGVVHAWAAGGRREYYDINVTGTENVLQGCRREGIQRLIYVSSPSVIFDGSDHRNAREDAPYPKRFASAYSWSKKLGEDRVNAAAQTGLETIILRPKAVFGPGDTSLLPRLIAAARAGRLPQIGDGTNEIDLTPVENVVEALCLCRDAPPEAAGRTYTITGGESAPVWDVIRRILTALGLPYPNRQVPVGAALAAASLMEMRALLTKKEPMLTRYSALILARTQTYDISAAHRFLNYKPVISLSDGVAQTIAALKAASQ